ncbi:E3 ubiquitin-protein ligase CCNB1IP1 [Eumeta japonica]|uniref:E3 ubiquitin-protein ligase CCNB1IP1 n=1 Tax=Eumeta variegata TaxID=151549 RepID=A0A4C1W1A1_EUMVA|nr:E3 ubiquitin-protein ligase CCNB1IP1 [Eumeta japonica]
MSVDLICNYQKCRKTLTRQAWVTTCSHAFCVEHGKIGFKRNVDNTMTCPACNSELRDKFDVIQADLNPGETFKSIVLAGMKPDMIMDVAMRAMSFWSYQVEQETLYQESLVKHVRNKLQCLEELNSLNAQKHKAELEAHKNKISSLNNENSKKKKLLDELTASLEDYKRKTQKLQFQLEAQKRKSFNINKEFEATAPNNENCISISELVAERTTANSFIFKPVSDQDEECSPKTPIFNFQQRRKQQSHFKFHPFS